MKNIPMRKRISPISEHEKMFYICRYEDNEEIVEKIKEGTFFEEEIDIPALYKLEKKIKNEFWQEDDLKDAFNFVESKRGSVFAEKLREEQLFKGTSYKLKEGSVIPIMKKFMTYVEELNKILLEYSPCKKGCSFCCDIPVAVSDLEILLIKEYLDKNHISYKKLNYNKIFSKTNDPKEIIGKKYTGIKCPFLKNNSCSVYPARPFVCKKHIAIGNLSCSPTIKNKFDDGGYIILNTYDLIISYHMGKNIKRYLSLLDPMQIELSSENHIFRLQPWQKYSDIRDNFSE